MSLRQRVRSALVTTAALALTATAAAVLPASPAEAVPSVSGDYASLTVTPVQSIRELNCVNGIANVKTAIDLQAIGNSVASQGYYTSSGNPVYTSLNWTSEYTVTGPDNYYKRVDQGADSFPRSERDSTIDMCPSDFGTSKMKPGTYTVTYKVGVFSYKYTNPICSKLEGCMDYPKIYEKTGTTTFTLDYSQTCKDARAAYAGLKANVSKARAALKKAKQLRGKAKVKAVRKAKAQVAKARSALATNLQTQSNSC